MKKRMILMLTVMVVFIAGVGLVKFMQIRAAIAQYASYQPAPEAVTTIVAKQETWPSTHRAIGTLVAMHGVDVSADLPGVVNRITFVSGRPARAGEVLVELDTKQERAQLAAAEAQFKLDQITLARFQELKTKGVTSQAELDKATAEAQQSEARAKEIEATIERKTLRAPFSGILGIRKVNLGQYLNPGDPVVSLQSLDPIYVDFSIPQQELEHLRIGQDLHVTAEGTGGGDFVGKISAINSIVDEATRNVQVRAEFANPDGRLLPGMFVEAEVDLGQPGEYIALPASAINYAPYGNSVFIVETMAAPDGRKYQGVRQQFVGVGPSRGDQIAILNGVSRGDTVVTSGVFKLRNGAAIQINNDIQPSNSPAPRPEDS
jgi:membrane fusion protein, multidrug efflux system